MCDQCPPIIQERVHRFHEILAASETTSGFRQAHRRRIRPCHLTEAPFGWYDVESVEDWHVGDTVAIFCPFDRKLCIGILTGIFWDTERMHWGACVNFPEDSDLLWAGVYVENLIRPVIASG